MAKDVTVTIRGKETVSQAAGGAVQGLNKLRTEVNHVAQAAKFLAGGAAGVAVIRFLNDSVKAYRDSEVAAAKLAGTMLTGPAASLVALDKAFIGLKVAAGEAFATAARPVIDWLARVATDAASAGRQVRAAKEALDAIGKGEKISATADAIAGLNREILAVRQQEMAWAVSSGESSESISASGKAQIAAVEERIALIRDAAVEQAVAADTIKKAVAEGAVELAFVEKVNAAWVTTQHGQDAALRSQIAMWQGMLAEANVTAPKIIEIIEMLQEKLQEPITYPSVISPEYEKMAGETAELLAHYDAVRERATEPIIVSIVMPEYEKTAGEMQELIDYYDALGERTESLGDKTKKLAEDTVDLSGALATGLGSAFEAVGQALVDFEEGWAALGQAAMGTIAGILEALGQAFLVQAIGKAAAAILLGPGALFAAAAIAFVTAGIVRAMSAKMVGMAEGGIINEPIIGRGLRTGTTYAFGEAGPEIVTPMNKMPRSGVTIIQHIEGSVIREEELHEASMKYAQKASRGY